MESAVLLAICVGLVTRIDDRALDHRIERDFGLEEVRALGELIVAGMPAVLAADLAGAAPDLARREEGKQGLDDLLEGRAAVHQIVLVAAVAVALAVAVVLVDQHLRAGRQQLVRLAAADLDDALAGLLVDHEIPCVRDFRARVLGMRVIDVVTRAVDQRLVAGDVLLLVGRVLLALDLEAARIGQRVLLVVVPENLAVGIFAIGVHDQDAGRNRIEVRVVLDHDPELDLCAHDSRDRHLGFEAPGLRLKEFEGLP